MACTSGAGHGPANCEPIAGEPLTGTWCTQDQPGLPNEVVCGCWWGGAIAEEGGCTRLSKRPAAGSGLTGVARDLGELSAQLLWWQWPSQPLFEEPVDAVPSVLNALQCLVDPLSTCLST
jgi:hypothetical protein